MLGGLKRQTSNYREQMSRQVTIPGVAYSVNSLESTVRLRLDELLPGGLDVASLMFADDPPECLQRVGIDIGG